jgi:hypothetical protein
MPGNRNRRLRRRWRRFSRRFSINSCASADARGARHRRPPVQEGDHRAGLGGRAEPPSRLCAGRDQPEDTTNHRNGSSGKTVLRSKAVYLALAVLPDGTRDILGIWIEQTEGAKFWMKVFTDLKTRGCHDILIAVTDRLLDFANWKQRKPMAAALRPIYTAASADAASVALDTFAIGPWGPVFCVSARGTACDLHDECARERQRARAKDHQDAWTLPDGSPGASSAPVEGLADRKSARAYFASPGVACGLDYGLHYRLRTPNYRLRTPTTDYGPRLPTTDPDYRLSTMTTD